MHKRLQSHFFKTNVSIWERNKKGKEITVYTSLLRLKLVTFILAVMKAGMKNVEHTTFRHSSISPLGLPEHIISPQHSLSVTPEKVSEESLTGYENFHCTLQLKVSTGAGKLKWASVSNEDKYLCQGYCSEMFWFIRHYWKEAARPQDYSSQIATNKQINLQ